MAATSIGTENSTVADGSTATDWLPGWRGGHDQLTTAVALTVAVVCVAAPQPPVLIQLLAIAPLVGIVGLPHGAYDGVIGEQLLRPRFGRAWPAVFGSTYIGLAVAVLALWWAMPAVALVAFLCYSAIHFGLEETEDMPATSWADILALGALPIALPAVGHPAEVAGLFGWLMPAGTAISPVLVGTAATPVAAAAVVWVLLRHRRPVYFAMAAVLLAAPPLVGFAVYFCLWHSVGHASSIAAGIDRTRPAIAWKTFARRSLPATALSAATAVAAAVWLTRTTGVGPAAARAVFVTLAALTVPHMLLDFVAAVPREPRPGVPTISGSTIPIACDQHTH